jgi:hypothetical protein
MDDEGRVVAEVSDVEPLPILAGSHLKRSVVFEKILAAGHYTINYRIDFQDGAKAVEGVTDMIVKPTLAPIASVGKTPPKP